MFNFDRMTLEEAKTYYRQHYDRREDDKDNQPRRPGAPLPA